MSDDVREQVQPTPPLPMDEAQVELKALDFEPGDNGIWSGALDCGEYGVFPVELRLPADFPGSLPEIVVERSALPRRIPHVERSGKICVAPATGVLIDAANPRGVIAETLERARDALVKGLSGANDADFKNEFLAYWGVGAKGILWSVCKASGQSRPIKQASIVRTRRDKDAVLLLADNSGEAQTWASKMGRRVARQEEAFFVELHSAFIPPDFEEKMSTADVMEIIRKHSASQSVGELKDWLAGQHLPTTIVMSIPLDDLNAGRVMIAVRLEQAVGELARRARKGFRAGHVPADLEMRFTRDVPVTKFHIERFDADYLLTRGGATADFLRKRWLLSAAGRSTRMWPSTSHR